MGIRRAAIAAMMMFAAATVSAQYALPTVSVANLRGKPGHASELVSQVVTGTPLKVLSRQGSWIYVETPEGYKGHIRSNSLRELDNTAMNAWRNSERVVVTSPDRQWLHFTPQEKWSERVADVLPGAILEVIGDSENPDFIKAKLPDGREGYIRRNAVEPLSVWADEAVDDAPSKAVANGYSMMGTPYLWGGTSVLGVDCSGFTQTQFYRFGILLPRDASQQAKIGTLIYERKAGESVPADILNRLLPGDLLFFGNSSTRKVTHVGFYAGNGNILHCAGRVKVNTLLPGEGYDASLYLLSVRRLTPETIRALSVSSMPLYGIIN